MTTDVVFLILEATIPHVSVLLNLFGSDDMTLITVPFGSSFARYNIGYLNKEESD